MRLELSHIRQPETEFHKVFQPAELAGGDEEYRVTAPVDLRMVIHKDQDRFRLVGAVKTELELACSRCLEPFKLPVDRDFDLRFLPAGRNRRSNSRSIGNLNGSRQRLHASSSSVLTVPTSRKRS